LLLLLPLASGLGCVNVFGTSCPAIDEGSFVPVPESGIEPTCAERKLDADELNAKAIEVLKAGQLELGYRYLALIHILHPGTEQDREAFTLAARVFRKNHFRNRSLGGSVWVTGQPQFMFAWLAEFFRGQDEFPQHPVNAMFLGMHYGMFRDFQAYAVANAQQNPELARWVLSAKKDNGIVYSVTAVRSDGPAA
jgi:hypothetical protein